MIAETKLIVPKRTIKFITTTLLVTIILNILLQTAFNSQSEAKIIKIEDLKKAKKYAYLLAPLSKKLYAVPVPVPLPVFVKRQHIYTQVPVIPRYVQQPYYSTSSASGSGGGTESYDPYAAVSNQSPEYQSSSAQSARYQPIQQQVKPVLAAVSSGQQQQLMTSTDPAKYLAQLANAIGHAYPVLGAGSNPRDVVGKLLAGQVKMLPASQIRVGSLIASLKQQSAAEQNRQQQHQEAAAATAAAITAAKLAASSETGSGSNSTSKTKSSEAAAATAGNELYLSGSSRHPYRKSVSDLAGELYRYQMSPSMQQAYALQQYQHLSPSHAAVWAHAAQLNPFTNSATELMYPQIIQAATNGPSIESSMELAAPDAANDYEPLMTPLGHSSSSSGDQQQQQERLFEVMQHQQALRSAAIAGRKHEEAQLAQSDKLALAAQHYGLPLLTGKLRMLKY